LAGVDTRVGMKRRHPEQIFCIAETSMRMNCPG